MVDAFYRSLQYEWETRGFLAVSSIYGVELLSDNVSECRERLFEYFKSRYTRQFKKKISEKFLESIKFLLKKNIICGDALTLLTSEGEPIVFSEWSFVSGSKVQRRDFTMSNLLESNSKHDLLDLIPEEKLPKEIGRYPVTHYLEITNYD